MYVNELPQPTDVNNVEMIFLISEKPLELLPTVCIFKREKKKK